MAEQLKPYSVIAFNAAKQSENKMHDDAVARKFGFGGGLVPGVDVFAYMTHFPLKIWGREFLERGQMEGRFGKPVYDGDSATVTAVERDGGLDIQIESRGIVCGTSRAALPDASTSISLNDYKLAVPPDEERRPPVDAGSFPAGSWVNSRPFTVTPAFQAEYLSEVSEAHSIYAREGIVHSGTILRAVNWALSHNAKLGPWIHVGSTLRHLGLGRVGDEISVRAKVTANYDKKGHKFVELDALIIANDTAPIARVDHVAIYEPRQVAAA